MENRFKFRAWDKEKERMEDHEQMCRFGAAWSDFDQSKRFEFMQYTGLLDKNGKEIYEGDILEKNYGIIEPLLVGDKEKFAKRWRVEFFRGQFVMNCIGIGFSERLSDFAEERAVIGNIYSNPDLLNNKS